MKINTAQLTLFIFFFTAINSLMLLAGGLSAFTLLKTAASNRPPDQAAMIQLVSLPPDVPVCPGGTLNYIFEARPLRFPLVVRITRTVLNDKGVTVVPGSFLNLELLAWNGAFVKEERFYTVPETDRFGDRLPPGKYTLRVALNAEETATTTFDLPFKIKAC